MKDRTDGIGKVQIPSPFEEKAMTRFAKLGAFLGAVVLPMTSGATDFQLLYSFDPTVPQLGCIDWQFPPLANQIGDIDPSRISSIKVTFFGSQSAAPDRVLMSNVVDIPGWWQPWMAVGQIEATSWVPTTITLTDKQTSIFADNVLSGLIMRIDVFGENDPLYLSYARLDVVVEEPLVELTGSVVLHDWSATREGIPVMLDLAKGGQIVESIPAVLDEKGVFHAGTRLRGEFDVLLKAPHWLRKQYPNPVTIGEEGLGGLDFWLPNGDIDGDNEIGIGDYARLSSAFNAMPFDPNWDPMADLNGDQSVDIGDYAVMSLLYGQFGD
ncbi:MAG: hypothetical protein K1X67_02005 [Fimbriimonadaceae bacterium]|nr:hypothetical protein [Fimbriimonadaceae bacterium]